MADERMSGLTPTQKDKEWYERTKEENRPLGSRAIDAAESLSWGLDGIVQSSATLRTLMQGAGLLGKKIEEGREYAEGVATGEANYGIDSFPAYPGAVRSPVGLVGEASNMLRQGSEFLRQGATEFAEDRAIPAIEQATGKQVDPRTADIYGAAVGAVPSVLTEEALTLGAGTAVRGLRSINRIGPPPPSLQVNLAGVNNFDSFIGPRMQQFEPPTVMELTLKDRENIPKGIKQGSAFKDPKFATQMRDFYQRRANIKERLQAAVDRKSKRVGKFKEEEYNTISTGPSRAPELNPEAYGDKKAFEKYKEQSEITPLTSSGKTRWQQQHHLFSKQESYQFVERMIELGDDDDVLSLFIMAEDMDAVMGGRLSNMLNMEDLPHSVFHGSRITDKRQLKSAEMRNLVENAKSTDELMRMFREYVTENVLPSKEEAKAFKIIGQRLLKADKFKNLEQIRDKMYR